MGDICISDLITTRKMKKQFNLPEDREGMDIYGFRGHEAAGII